MVTQVLFSMIINEYNFNGDFHLIEVAIVDHFLISSSDKPKSDSYRPDFLERLRQLALDSESIDSILLQQIITFLESMNDCLILLSDARQLPDSSEYDDDRKNYNLRIMTVIISHTCASDQADICLSSSYDSASEMMLPIYHISLH